MIVDRTIIPDEHKDHKGRPRWFHSWEGYDKYYTAKAEFLASLNVKSAMSLGVRSGILGACFLKLCKNTKLILSDTSNTLAVKPKDFADRFPTSTVEFRLPGPTTVAHVDVVIFNPDVTDPTELKVWLEYAIQCSNKVVILDYGYKHHAILRAAVDSFIKEHAPIIKAHNLVENYYTDMVLEINNA